MCRKKKLNHSVGTTVIGTPGVMSPEQAKWNEEAKPESDVYSLAAMLLPAVITPASRDPDKRTAQAAALSSALKSVMMQMTQISSKRD